jgi:hypothetical protein
MVPPSTGGPDVDKSAKYLLLDALFGSLKRRREHMSDGKTRQTSRNTYLYSRNVEITSKENPKQKVCCILYTYCAIST